MLLRKAAVARLLFLGLVGFFASTRVQIFVHFVDDVCVLQAMAEGAVAPFTLPLTLLHSNTHTRVSYLRHGHAGDHLPNKTQRRSQCSLAARGQTDGRTGLPLDCCVAEAAQPVGQTLPADDSTSVSDTIIKQKIG